MDDIQCVLGTTLCRRWPCLLARGIATITIGVILAIHPRLPLAGLAGLFGMLAMLDGGIDAFSAIGGLRNDRAYWLVLFLGGLVGVSVGVMTLMTPLLTAIVVSLYFAIWAIATGALEMLAAIRVRAQAQDASRRILDGIATARVLIAGIASVAFGAVLTASPRSSTVTMLWVVSAYALGYGILLVMLALKLRGVGRQLARA